MAVDTQTLETIPQRLMPPESAIPPGDYQPLGHLKEGYSLAVCILPSQETRANIQAVSAQLQQEFPSHHYAPEKHLRIALGYLGIFGTEQEAKQVYGTKLRELADNTQPFNISIRGMNHLPECFFADVYNDEDHLDPLHRALARIAPTVQQPGFLPHIPMGYPNSPRAHDLFMAISTRYARTFFGEEKVSAVCLTSTHTRAKLNSPDPIKILDEYSFGSK